MKRGILLLLPILAIAGCSEHSSMPAAEAGKVQPMSGETIVKSDEEWKKELTPEQYHILRQKGTERAFTGKYTDHTEKGIYSCAGCGQELFESETKFGSHCGWPSFWEAMDKSKVAYHDDSTFGMQRVEVTCSRCGGHLGHIFDDGPPPTGKRFCINSASLTFKPPAESTARPAGGSDKG